jgi:hypothetical protein
MYVYKANKVKLLAADEISLCLCCFQPKTADICSKKFMFVLNSTRCIQNQSEKYV